MKKNRSKYRDNGPTRCINLHLVHIKMIWLKETKRAFNVTVASQFHDLEMNIRHFFRILFGPISTLVLTLNLKMHYVEKWNASCPRTRKLNVESVTSYISATQFKIRERGRARNSVLRRDWGERKGRTGRERRGETGGRRGNNRRKHTIHVRWLAPS